MTNQLAIQFSAADKVLIIAPHPDDEAIAVSGLIQTALQEGAAVKVAFLTKGENNPWPQRVMERKIVIRPEDKQRFAECREKEAIASLALLGVSLGDVHFLGLRDQKISDILYTGDLSSLAGFLSLLHEWQPSLLFVPSPLDLHPDHSAFGVLVRDASADALAGFSNLRVFYYVVHPYLFPHESEQYSVRLDERMMEKKRQALLCYETQCVFWKKRLMSYVVPQECFHDDAFVVQNKLAAKMQAELSEDRSRLFIKIRLSPALFLSRGARLYIVAHIKGENYRQLSFRIHAFWSRIFTKNSCLKVMLAKWFINIEVPMSEEFSAADFIYAKLENPFVLYDKTGWLQVKDGGAHC